MWFYALKDLHELLPFPASVDVELMSTIDIHRACLRMAQVSKRWRARHISPSVIFEADCGRIRDIKLLPWGKHLVALKHDGGSVVHSIRLRGSNSVDIANGNHYTRNEGFEAGQKIQLETVEVSNCKAYVVCHYHGVRR